MIRPAITALVALLTLTPAVAAAAIAWEIQNAQGNLGKVEHLMLSTSGAVDWSTRHGFAKIGSEAYHWGGTQCETDISGAQIATLQAAMTAGLNVQPIYRKPSGVNARCLVMFTVFRT